MKRSKPLAWVIVSLCASCGLASAQPLRAKLDEAKKAIAGLVAYPPEIRLAILEICQKPQLVLDMAKTGKLPDLQKEPESVQKAANELVKHPEIVKTLSEHIGIVAIVGRFYARAPAQAVAAADKLAAEAEKEEEEQKEKWMELLEENQKALEEFTDAVEEMTKAQEAGDGGGEGAAPAEEGYPPAAAAEAAVSGDTVTVYSGPSGEMVDYLLSNADQYANAAAQALQYWQAYQAGALGEAVLSDLAGLANLGDIVANPGILGDWASLRGEFPKAKERLANHRDRIENIASRRGEFPNLASRVDGFSARNPGHKLSEWRKNPRKGDRAPKGLRGKRDKAKRPSKGSGRRSGKASLRSGKRSQGQRMSSGSRRHRNSWQGMSGGRSGGRRGGGFSPGRGGGGRRGGGRGR